VEQEGGPVIAVGDSGTILRTTDSGETWVPLPVLTSQALRNISDFPVHAVGDSGTILHTTDFGETWTLEESPTTVRLHSISDAFSIPLIAGDSGVVLRKTPVTPWEITNTGTTADMFGVPMFSIGNLVVGANGSILRSTDFGQNWSPQNSPVTTDLRAVEFSANNDTHIYAVGDSGTIIASTSSGNAWTVQQSGTTRDLRGMFFYLSDLDGWVVGDSGTILRTFDGGWSPDESETPTESTPSVMAFQQNYPNPFNNSTSFVFTVSRTSSVVVRAYDVLGRQVGTLADRIFAPGDYHLTWECRHCTSGTYLVSMSADGFSATRVVRLIR
jgi:hypothetical protein